MEKELFVLLRLGLQTENVNDVSAQAFWELSQEDWLDIRKMADYQSVSAIVFDGLNILVDTFGKDTIAPHVDKGWWRQYVFGWMGVVTQTEQRNKRQLEVMNDMASQWTAEGCCVMVFKGQTSGTMYPHPEHRSPGDIDCYLINEDEKRRTKDDKQAEAYKRGNEIAREVGAKVNESWYKHSVISYRKETFENHQYFVHTRDGKRGKQLNDELVEGLKVHGSWFMDERAKLTEFTYMPPVQWAAMFLTYHACAHFVSEGLRLKQILDWAMFLKAYQNDVDWPAFYGFCERNHLRRFADAMNAIAKRWLGVSVEGLAISESPYAEKILNSALYDEDYVFSSGASGWKNRWHLVRNLFKYRWKYEEIYQQSVWKQLWWYVTGFLFKTE